jgi:thioredoxin reductase (NADPH)
MASAVILAIGTVSQKTFPGEKEYLGRGVSYCAVCDGMLYRGKNICVYGDTDEAIGEAKYLRDIGCNVTYISKEKPSGDDINYITSNSLSIVGGERAEKVILDDTEIQCDGVFIMRPSVAPAVMLPGLQIQDGHIKAEQNGETSIPGVFAAGDCTGLPYQVAKAVGEGQTVAFAAVKYLNNRR